MDHRPVLLHLPVVDREMLADASLKLWRERLKGRLDLPGLSPGHDILTYIERWAIVGRWSTSEQDLQVMLNDMDIR